MFLSLNILRRFLLWRIFHWLSLGDTPNTQTIFMGFPLLSNMFQVTLRWLFCSTLKEQGGFAKPCSSLTVSLTSLRITPHERERRFWFLSLLFVIFGHFCIVIVPINTLWIHITKVFDYIVTVFQKVFRNVQTVLVRVLNLIIAAYRQFLVCRIWVTKRLWLTAILRL